METTRKSFDLSLAKGEYGERIVRRVLEAQGFVVYGPKTEGAHAFDVLAIKDKSRCIAIDVKAKARRNKYPDTGVNVRHYETYLNFSQRHNMPFWIVFVDEMIGAIYGNSIENLDRPVLEGGISYPLVYSNQVRYWPISSMLTLHRLTALEIADLERLSQRCHGYSLRPAGEAGLGF